MIHSNDIPVVDFTEASTVRLISTAYLNEPALAPLADDEAELDVLARLETLTATRHHSMVSLPIGLSADELVNESSGYGWTYINAAFCYTRASGNRFNSVERGAWYAAYGRSAVETVKAEIVFHLTRELENTGVFENTTRYQELKASFATRFHDLHAVAKSKPDFLDKEIDVAYPAGQVLAKTLIQSGSNGVLYPSARRSRGKCLAVFKPNLIQNVRQGKTWLFEWTGSANPVVTAG